MSMLKEVDVINAWLRWGKMGLEPPKVNGKSGFVEAVKRMHKHFKEADPAAFEVAAVIVGKKNRRWPTIFDIEQAIRQRER